MQEANKEIKMFCQKMQSRKPPTTMAKLMTKVPGEARKFSNPDPGKKNAVAILRSLNQTRTGRKSILMQGDDDSTGQQPQRKCHAPEGVQLTEAQKTELPKAQKIVADAIATAEATVNAWTPLPPQAVETKATAEVTSKNVEEMLPEATPGGAQTDFGLVHGGQRQEAALVTD